IPIESCNPRERRRLRHAAIAGFAAHPGLPPHAERPNVPRKRHTPGRSRGASSGPLRRTSQRPPHTPYSSTFARAPRSRQAPFAGALGPEGGPPRRRRYLGRDLLVRKPALTTGTAKHRELGLTDAEYELIVAQLGRDPNDVELAMFSLLWSEHCAYKHSRKL